MRVLELAIVGIQRTLGCTLGLDVPRTDRMGLINVEVHGSVDRKVLFSRFDLRAPPLADVQLEWVFLSLELVEELGSNVGR
jgi:hypothetical protein